MLEKKILGQESFDAAGAEKFAEGGQEGSKEEKNNLHVGECRAEGR